MERELCVVWAGWCRRGGWDAGGKGEGGDGMAMWVGWRDGRGVVGHLSIWIAHLRWVGRMLAIRKRKPRLLL